MVLVVPFAAVAKVVPALLFFLCLVLAGRRAILLKRPALLI
jgi:hypothetical protein